MRRYWKAGYQCWDEKHPKKDFLGLLRDERIVICGYNNDMRPGDIVALAHGTSIRFLAKITGSPAPVTERSGLEAKFETYEIGKTDDDKDFQAKFGPIRVAQAELWEIPPKDWIDGKGLRKGICEIQDAGKKKIIPKIRELVRRKEAMDKVNEYKKLLEANRNLVLTGAPGTGKTHLAGEIAKEMGAYSEKAQFHPSYDYTDFVEGLRPVQKDGVMGFERRDGAFKEFCKHAWLCRDTDAALDLFREDIARARNELEIGEGYVVSAKENGFEITSKNNVRWSVLTLDRLKTIFDQKELKTAVDPKAAGEENKDTTGAVDPATAALAKYVKENYPVPHVFIIDEINRGEIAKIFGELFSVIEPGYRMPVDADPNDKGNEKYKIKTQYQNLVPEGDIFANGFFVPENVYVIGAMNDIDRGVDAMDFAMRRRFAWREVTAKESQRMLDSEDAWKGKKPEPGVLDEIKTRMDRLNAAIAGEEGPGEGGQPDGAGLTTAHQIGAAYFLKYALYNDFNKLWEYHLEGLLREYLRGMPDSGEKMELLEKAYNNDKPAVAKLAERGSSDNPTKES